MSSSLGSKQGMNTGTGDLMGGSLNNLFTASDVTGDQLDPALEAAGAGARTAYVDSGTFLGGGGDTTLCQNGFRMIGAPPVTSDHGRRRKPLQVHANNKTVGESCYL